MNALRTCALLLCISLLACGVATPPEDLEAGGVERSAAPLTLPEVTVRFNADWTVTQSGPLLVGGKVRFAYDAARLPGCRGDFNGKPGWAITGSYRLNAGPVGSFEAGGFSSSNGTNPPVVTVDAAGDLAVWFQINSRWGCQEWDSAFGANYHFNVLATPHLQFAKTGPVQVEGTLAGVPAVIVDYALERLPNCRQTYNGLATWDIVAFYRFDNGVEQSKSVTVPAGVNRVAAPAELVVPQGAKSLELWFRNTDRTDCVAWDSQFGQNYRFSL
jgi:hypothetical protein